MPGPIVYSGQTSPALNQYPVNFKLMRNLLLSAKAVAPYLVGTMPGVLQRNSGTDTVKWERIENFTPQTTPLGELTVDDLPTRPSFLPTITPVTAAMLKYGLVTRVSEELDLMSVNATSEQFSRKLGENAGRTLSLVARDIWETDIDAAASGPDDNRRYSGGTNTGVPATDRATVAAALGGVDAQWANNYLNRNDGMEFRSMGFGSTNIDTRTIRNSFVGIVHSDVEEDVRQNAGDFRSAEQYGGYTQLYPGEFGASYGIRWISTSLAKIIPDAGGAAGVLRSTTGTSADVYVSYIYAEEALGTVGLGEQHTKEIYLTGDRLPAVEMIQHGRGSSGTADALNEIATVGWKAWFTGRVLNGLWVTKVESGATKLT